MAPASLSYEDAPSREPMKATRSGRKARGDFLLQLRRFLLGNKERPWDDVYRELRATLCTTSTERRMLQGRLADLVALDVVLLGDELVRAGTQRPLAQDAPPTNLYVCPTSGLLSRVKADDRHKIRVSEWELIRRVGKRWYLLSLAPLPAEGERPWCVDAVLRDAVNEPSPRLHEKLTRLYGRPGVFARDKRQLGKAELGRLRAAHEAPPAR